METQLQVQNDKYSSIVRKSAKVKDDDTTFYNDSSLFLLTIQKVWSNT
jgi:hypothetical protein